MNDKAWHELTGPRARARAFKARHGFWENYHGNEAKKARHDKAHHESKAARGGKEGASRGERPLQEEALKPAKKTAAKKTGAK